MGYCMTQIDSSFFIPKENKKEALDTLKKMDPEKNGSGGSWSSGKALKHYAWTSNDALEKTKTLEQHLDEWRWSPELDDEENIIGLQFEGEKLGDDFLMFQVLAPFVEEGSFIEMQGEDGWFWLWKFKNGACVELTGEIKYPDDDDEEE